ncbi:MAG TPA: bifunctional phosphoribosyl-AMP cyclohydrolase/phosphoribosyl-ATP diphosphatase HisIE [Thermoanaerobaculia bacterium]|nr:bifunctional phosphoribosyl-AMP cyclohydrolase/phosphoribosyl-ATP diphosphatase HisIE [Thermoanaerobaculia bacterium]
MIEIRANASTAASGSAAPAVSPAALRYDAQGLLPQVVQDVASGAVLMVGWANREAIEATLATGRAHFWSRSRQELWRKGETSGNVLEVVEVRADCDLDALLVRAHPAGPTCHTGERSCFEPNPAALELGWLAAVLEQRRGADPTASHTARLLAEGIDRVAQKVGEEAVETVIAAVSGVDSRERRARFVGEAADLLYHLLTLLTALGVEPSEVAAELAARHRSRSSPQPSRPQGEPKGDPA